MITCNNKSSKCKCQNSKLIMKIANVPEQDKISFNKLAPHPLQSWEWGEFRKKTGLEVVRLGRYVKNKLIETAQITIHPIPFTNSAIGYLPKGRIPSQEMLEKLVELGKQFKCIFIKIEPNIEKENKIALNIQPSPHPLFTKYTFQLDLTPNEDQLLKNLHPKTRYNIKVAQKHGVVITEDNSDKTFKTYLDLLMETTKRQKFFAHNRKYHELMWETLRPPAEGGGQALTAHLLKAIYQGEILATWILFLLNDTLYYPYGASSNKFRNTMASNLMMWEAIRFGKNHGAKVFDMWGALEPNPSKNDPWYGFHRFKEGYNAKLVEFVGSFDLVVNPTIYGLYNLVHKGREVFLKIKSNFPTAHA